MTVGLGLSPIPPKPLCGLGDEAGGSENRKSTAHSFYTRQQFAASGERNEPRRVAASRSGWRRTARLKEPQEHGQQFSPIRSSTLAPNSDRFGLSPIPPKPLRGLGEQAGASASRGSTAPIHRPKLSGSSSARLPRAADASLRPRTAIPHGIALLALAPK